MEIADILLSISACVGGIVIFFVMLQLCLYRKEEVDLSYHLWYRYYNRFTGKIAKEYWNECRDKSGRQIEIWHKSNGFDWKISWLKRFPGPYDWFSPYYEHTRTGSEKCDDSNRDRIVKAFLFENGVDYDP